MIRVFPTRNKWTPTDELTFIGDPPVILPPKDTVAISCTFLWHKQEALRLYEEWKQYYRDVSLGGPAFDDPGGEFIPGRFIKEGVTITSRGCCFNCPWCFVPKREGKIRELKIKDGWIINDNNLLACSRDHIEKVFDMCSRQKKGIEFKGGIDNKLLQPWHIDLFKAIKIKEIWVACDTEQSLHDLERSSDLLSDFPINKKRCFVLLGFNDEPITIAEKRLQKVFYLGFLPFAQLYRNGTNERYTQEWKDLARKWSRPAAYRSVKNNDEGMLL